VEDFLRDLVIKTGGPWPVIGGSVVLVALLGWVAYKLYAEGSKAMWIAIGAAVVILIEAIAASPQAVEACKAMYHDDYASYRTKNCEQLAHCGESEYLCQPK